MSIAMPEPIATPAQAFAAIALAAVACDGELATLEVRALRQQLEFRQPYRDYSDETMAMLLDQLLAILREQGCEGLTRQAVPLLTAQQQETAFAMAALLVLADHVQASSERRFLEQLADQLGISATRSTTILEVINLLNRDSLAS